MNDIVGTTKKDRLTLAFLENLRALCYIFDPYRGHSLASQCIKGAKYGKYYEIELDKLLCSDSVQKIRNNEIGDLSIAFHNLSANYEKQL